MAENKGIMLAKSVQKHAGRAKEKILQNLGKVDRTADEIFDDHLNNFNRQQASANRLQKEFNNYIRCVRAVQTASKSLMDAICEIYEPQWVGYDALQAQTNASDSLWQDFAHKLADQVLIPLNTYTGQFPEMKKKVEKRNRKLIDYDGQRHSFQSLQANANKRKDDVKLTKGRDQLEEARRTYEILNTELHDELPALYDSRILFLVTNLQTLFATEQVFHNETSKTYSELEAIVDKLATESQRGSNTLRKQTSTSSPVKSPVKQLNNTNNSNYQNQIATNGSSNANSPTSTSVSSHQTSRLDSVSPTPDSTPENLKAAITSSSVETNTTTTTIATTTPDSSNSPAAYTRNTTTAYQDAATLLATVTSMPNVNETSSRPVSPTPEANELNIELNSPNANTTAVTVATTAATSTSITEVHLHASDVAASVDDSAAELANNDAMEANKVKNSGNTTKSPKCLPTAVNNIEQLNGNTSANNNESTNGHGHIKATADINNGNTDDDVDDNNKKSTGDTTTSDLPAGVLYRVKATYGYVKEDVDELSFEVGDIIRVIEYDDPEDQEEGWLMGQKEGTNDKGLFPANFTRPI